MGVTSPGRDGLRLSEVGFRTGDRRRCRLTGPPRLQSQVLGDREVLLRLWAGEQRLQRHQRTALTV